jgi:hypothetical protein
MSNFLVRRCHSLLLAKFLSHLDILTEISQCSKQYVENRCSPDMRVPAMEKACSVWENCMKKDPSVVGRAKLSAETFAEIINGFIEPISYKTMVFILAALFGTIFLSNYAFSMARTKVSAGFPTTHTYPLAYAREAFTPLGQTHSPFSTPHSHHSPLLAIRWRGALYVNRSRVDFNLFRK